jgi:hypothetical protein
LHLLSKNCIIKNDGVLGNYIILGKKMKKHLFFLCILSLILVSCGKNDTGGTVLAPGENDPYIIEADLCTGIYNNFPSGITDYFYTGERVNLWVYWANVSNGQKVTVEWWSPGNNKDSEFSVSFQSTANRQISVNYIDLSSFASTGEWIAKLYLNNSFMRSYRFTVSKSTL